MIMNILNSKKISRLPKKTKKTQISLKTLKIVCYKNSQKNLLNIREVNIKKSLRDFFLMLKTVYYKNSQKNL